MRRTKIVAAMLSLVFVFMLFPGLRVNADASGTCGDNLNWELVSDTLTISYTGTSGSGDMADYTGTVHAPWYDQKDSIKTIVVDNGVTSIGDWAFAGFSVLESVTLPDSVSSIGDTSFGYCSKLSSIVLPNNLTLIDEYAFYECSSLTSIVFPSTLTTIGERAFEYCSGLTEIDIPDSVTTLDEQAFAQCTSLKSATLSNQLTELPGTFYGCSQLTTVTIPDSVTTLNGTFYYCTSLKNITIPDSVTSIGAAFESCTSLESITIPDSVTSIGAHAFFCCTSLTGITIPNSVTSIGDRAFFGCTSLTNVTMTQRLYDDIDPTMVFEGSSSTFNLIPSGYCGDPSVNGGKDVTWIFDDTTGTLTISGTGDMFDLDTISTDPWSAIYKSFKTIVINDGVTSIGNEAFYYCTNLTNITIPDSVQDIGVYAFRDCTSLTDVAMSKVLYDNLVQNNKLGSVFYGITLPSIHFSYTVNYKSNGNGTITGTTTQSFGTDQIELTITPDTGYEIDKVTWSDGTNPDVELTATNGKYTMPDSEAGTVTITASFKLIEYNISFVNEDGTVLQSSSVPYGDTPVCTITPTKAADEQYTYTFSGWTPAIVPVTGDATYTAVFTETAKPTTTVATTPAVTTPAPGTYYVQSIEEKDGAIVITIKRTENDDQTYELVQSIETDGKQLSVGDQIELTSGSAIITIKKDFVSTLTPGTHTMKVTFKDGGSITLEYTVKEPEKAAAQAVQATGEATAITAFVGAGLIIMACGLTIITVRKRREEA
ncbi:MAG: leucine-rich repeat domain-containing protein [Clostridiales bacterium]|nr:leucine-rich repeat domain-containing protein [Clostridiales bacterium]